MSGKRLVQAAAELIAEKGWEATTAAEIGRRAGYSRAMVHARYGSKDAILDTLFQTEYEQRLRAAPDPDANGLQRALAFLDRIYELHAEDRDYLRAMFVLSFEAIKRTSPARPRVRRSIKRGMREIQTGLRDGVDDGSVRADIDVDRAIKDVTSTLFGVAYTWIAVPERYDLRTEIANARTRFVREYGTREGSRK
jgi:AcrR family transcriptional regulator